MRSRGGGRRFRRSLIAAAVVVAGLAAWQVLTPVPREDRTNACRALATAVDAAAASRGLIIDETRSRAGIRTQDLVRWEVAERVYRVLPATGVRRAAEALRRVAVAQGFRAKANAMPGDQVAFEVAFADGRPALHAILRPKRWLAVIIDDMGYRMDTANRVCALPAKLTCAILPGTRFSRQVAKLARSRGKEVMLHMPMESPFKTPEVPEYATMIRHGMDRKEVQQRIMKALSLIPGVRSVNNHEGSSATIDPELMAHVMRALKPTGLGFIDSRTVAKSLAWRAAKEHGLHWGMRDVFLDADRNLNSVDRQFTLAVSIAKRKGVAIAIGHHHFPETLAVLEKRIPEATNDGIEFVHATAAMRWR